MSSDQGDRDPPVRQDTKAGQDAYVAGRDLTVIHQYAAEMEQPRKPGPQGQQHPRVMQPRILQVGQWVHAMALSQDNTRLATGSAMVGVRIWNLQTGAIVRKLRTGPDVAAAAFSPDGTRLAVGDMSNTAGIWDIDTRRRQFYFFHRGVLLRPVDWFTSSGWVHVVAFSPDGTRLATYKYKTVRIWDIADG